MYVTLNIGHYTINYLFENILPANKFNMSVHYIGISDFTNDGSQPLDLLYGMLTFYQLWNTCTTN